MKNKTIKSLLLAASISCLASCGNSGAKVSINSGEAKAMVEMGKKEGSGYKAQYLLEKLDLKANDALTFTFNGQDVTSSVLVEGSGDSNNMSKDHKVVNDATDASIRFTVYENNTYSAFVDGRKEVIPETGYTVKVGEKTAVLIQSLTAGCYTGSIELKAGEIVTFYKDNVELTNVTPSTPANENNLYSNGDSKLTVYRDYTPVYGLNDITLNVNGDSYTAFAEGRDSGIIIIND